MILGVDFKLFHEMRFGITIFCSLIVGPSNQGTGAPPRQ